jgi:hypothetical protein
MHCFKCDGSYQEKHDYYECPKCDDQLLPADTAKLIENKRKELLERYLQEQPIREFLSAAETAESLKISKQALHKHKRINNGFIYHTLFNGNRVYLKKSIDLYKKKGDGRFLINFSPKEKIADFQHDNVLMWSHKLRQEMVQRDNLFNYEVGFATKVNSDEWFAVIGGKKRGQEDAVRFNKSHYISKWSKLYAAKKSFQSYIQ